MAERRIAVRKDDVLIFKGFEIDAEVLSAIINPDVRVLWAFVKKDAQIQPVAYSETQCIWLTEEEVGMGIEG
jgi:hypothetical protein